MLYTILGGPLEGITEEQEEKLRLITLRHVYHMYVRNTRIKIGVGFMRHHLKMYCPIGNQTAVSPCLKRKIILVI